MMLLRAAVFSIALLVVYGASSVAEDTQKASEALLDRARQLSDIRSQNAPGFRLKVSFSFIEQNLDTVEGTYTEVWTSNLQWRRETVIGNSRRIEIGGPAKQWLVDGGKDFPEEASRVSTVVKMFPSRATKFEFESITDRDPATQCAITKPRGAKHQRNAFCVDKDSRLLVDNIAPELVGNRLADYSCRYGKFQKFGGYWFPREMACFLDGHRKMEAKVAELSLEPSPDAVLFTPPVGALEIGNCSQNPAALQPISTPDPIYPVGLRDRQSAVGLWMIVDTKGKPQDVKVTRSGGEPFDGLAMGAIREWRFKPGTCNGDPIPVPIAVEVRFRRH